MRRLSGAKIKRNISNTPPEKLCTSCSEPVGFGRGAASEINSNLCGLCEIKKDMDILEDFNHLIRQTRKFSTINVKSRKLGNGLTPTFANIS
jgi:hypothetical protein